MEKDFSAGSMIDLIKLDLSRNGTFAKVLVEKSGPKQDPFIYYIRWPSRGSLRCGGIVFAAGKAETVWLLLGPSAIKRNPGHVTEPFFWRIAHYLPQDAADSTTETRASRKVNCSLCRDRRTIPDAQQQEGFLRRWNADGFEPRMCAPGTPLQAIEICADVVAGQVQHLTPKPPGTPRSAPRSPRTLGQVSRARCRPPRSGARRP